MVCKLLKAFNVVKLLLYCINVVLAVAKPANPPNVCNALLYCTNNVPVTELTLEKPFRLCKALLCCTKKFCLLRSHFHSEMIKP